MKYEVCFGHNASMADIIVKEFSNPTHTRLVELERQYIHLFSPGECLRHI